MTREEALEVMWKNLPSDENLPVYEALQTLIPELRPKFKAGDIIAHNTICYEPDYFIVSVDEKGYNLKDGGFIGFSVQDDYCLVGRFNPNPTDSDAVPVRFEEEDGEKYPVVDYKLIERSIPAIQWKGNNLKDVIGFTGKSPLFDKWFKSWKEFEDYIHSHDDILKLFCEDGSHYEVPVGAWIVKTPDGYNIPSRFRFIQKPAEWSGRDEEIREFVLGLLDNLVWRRDWEISQAECLEWLVKNLQPTKKEWSEEDEKMRVNILNALTPQLVYSVGKGTYTGTSTYRYDDEIKWLKSLPERFNLQPKQEWGEEDERIFQHCLVILHDYGYDNWFKSICSKLKHK